MDRLSLFSPVTDEEVDDFNPLTTINLFIKYVDYLVTIGLEVRSSLFVWCPRDYLWLLAREAACSSVSCSHGVLQCGEWYHFDSSSSEYSTINPELLKMLFDIRNCALNAVGRHTWHAKEPICRKNFAVNTVFLPSNVETPFIDFQVADLPGVYDVPHLLLPSTSVLITGLLGHSPIFISTACSHLVRLVHISHTIYFSSYHWLPYRVKENLSALSKVWCKMCFL